jgi:Holliday junction DNA helicase RuvB
MTAEIDKIRPKCFDNYIGQNVLVKQVQVAMLSSLKRMDSFPHLIMAGPPGLGKTTMAEIIANEMNRPFIFVLASSIQNLETLEQLLGKLPFDGYDLSTGEILEQEAIRPGIIFIDEIHRLKNSITESLHTALEDFKISLPKKDPITGRKETGVCWIPRFTLIGATNYLGNLPKPFLDRFVIKLVFEIYNLDEIVAILLASAGNIEVDLDIEAATNIAKRSRGVPRIANSYLLQCRDVSIAFNDRYEGGVITTDCVEETFKLKQIDNLGLTKLDRKVLRYLAEVKRPIGINAIAQGVNEDRKTIESTVEPWMVQQYLIVRTPQGRVITEKGIEHIGLKPKSETKGLRRLE